LEIRAEDGGWQMAVDAAHEMVAGLIGLVQGDATVVFHPRPAHALATTRQTGAIHP